MEQKVSCVIFIIHRSFNHSTTIFMFPRTILVNSIFVYIHYLNDCGRRQFNSSTQKESCQAFGRLHSNNQFVVAIRNRNRAIDIIVIHFFIAIHGRNINNFGSTNRKAIKLYRINRKCRNVRNGQIGWNIIIRITPPLKGCLRSIITFFSEVRNRRIRF